MSFEILFLPKSWFHGARHSFANLAKILNKGYDKPRLKYNILQTQRIPSVDSLLENLILTPDDELGVFLLLGGEKEFALLKDQGLVRSFDDNSVESAFDCDIPTEFVSYFDLEKLSESTLTVADANYVLSDQTVDRVLATLALRSYDKQSSPNIKPFILTAYTSFMKNAASNFLEFVLNHLLLDPKYFNILSNTGDISKYERLSIHADCIVEHGILGYYTSKCRFEDAGERLLVKVGSVIDEDDSSAHYKALEATRDFHIAYIRRDIDIR
ncbi:hypothetical protein KGF57_001690 [Candida theae]|uniref:Uncharacterized protein n=1 Tax=Candida theae TaxID=1198502 RepID=A0AAD5BH55_9ASCO|nr:uncharacterized protein KGF57_001690 [Candida theae]KAI5961565.1 hypothetical protein KGF57_001690 [Candida theae]